MSESEKDYGFGQGENILTVVQRMPQGTAVVQGPASAPAVEEAIDLEDVADVAVEVIADTPPAAVHPLARVSDEPEAKREAEQRPEGKRESARKPEPKREAAKAPESKPAEKKSEARSAFGPVGPDPKQEAARSVSVSASPTGPTGPTGARKSPTGPTGRRG